MILLLFWFHTDQFVFFTEAVVSQVQVKIKHSRENIRNKEKKEELSLFLSFSR